MLLSIFLVLVAFTSPHRGKAFVAQPAASPLKERSFTIPHDSAFVATHKNEGSPWALHQPSPTTTALSLSLERADPDPDADAKRNEKALPPPTYDSLFKFRTDILEYLETSRSEDLKELAGDLKHQFEYQEFAQGFNRRFKPRPYFVVLCRCTEDVQKTYVVAKRYNIPVRIRASGHDHEGESSGDGLVVIDVSNMDEVKISKDGVAHIGPGNKFEDLTTKLANEAVMVPHGTCGTVAIAGFTMGGGWGPYTRQHGMCCEKLVGATVILGDGSRIDVDDNTSNGESLPELLWALRGGGGFSYGLVTELRIKAFHLAEELIRFTITWNPYDDKVDGTHPSFFSDDLQNDVTTLDVLKMWENSIASCETSQLIGTNLQVTGRHRAEDEEIDYEKVHNNCVMYGYWEGDSTDLKNFVQKWYGDYALCNLDINPRRGGTNFTENEYGKNLMSDWARIDTAPVLRAAAVRNPERFALSNENTQLIKEGRPLPPDIDVAAPHKITNRLVNKLGLQEEGFKAYIESMWSPLILPGNRNLGLNQYATLGAIVGDYYQDPNNLDADSKKSSFPYKDKWYTIQYQTWWNDKISDGDTAPDPIEGPVYQRTNRALDWMEVVRDFSIPNTSGAFISFKDSSVPTETYFQQNYERLVEAKKNYSMDPNNYFRSRKTII